MILNVDQPLVHLQADMVMNDMHSRRKVSRTLARAGVLSESKKIDKKWVNDLYREFARQHGV